MGTSGHRTAGEPEMVDVLRSSLPPAADVARLADVFGLMADPGRIRILATLLEAGEVCVHDLASVSGLSESSVSQALRLMRAQRVVATRRSGRHVFYRLDDSHVRMLLDLAITHVGHSPAISAALPAGSEPSIHPIHQEPS
ncbi:ArsR/SmtB family transcription factor [Neomicrococcus lactis]|uniref:ArsR/SmtB family transcription factor n=1 Tax=Neomicrococcus lactis TaxID=732241 RepID=UPI0022FFC6AD|nr:metalloregulator ArsR/SmtB family transcription factor [Neomicrococcus lactis]